MAWNEVRVPPPMMANRHGGLVTAVTEIDELGLVMIMDVEKVLADTTGMGDEATLYQGVETKLDGITILFADDSIVARKQIQNTLDKMNVNYISTINGKEAWEQLSQMADEAERTGENIINKIQLILTDVEMPEMDGYDAKG